MNQITDDRQQQCLEKFFAKEKTWYPDYFGCKFAAYMMFFVALSAGCFLIRQSGCPFMKA